MQRLLIRWVLMAVSVVLASIICTSFGLDFHAQYGTAAEVGKLLIGVVVLALLNATLGRLIRLVTLPLSCITLGLFSLVVNGIVLYIAAQANLGFSGNFLGSLVASLLISFLNGMLGMFIPDKDAERE
ncbi:phage holin family protein [bacterium]|nr:MAG: phage holin family protein [bacterium]